MKHTLSVCRILLAFLLMLPAVNLFGQRQVIKNLPYYDQRLLHWGFCLGVNAPDITFEHSGSEAAEGWWVTCPEVNPAFFVGLMGDAAITEHLNLRVSPLLYFQERQLRFERTLAGGEREHLVQPLKTTYLELPVSLKVSTRRINNYRPYLVGGVQADLDMSHEHETPVVFERFDLGLHIGVGCDVYLPFFKLAPELRFHLGLLDMIDHKREGIKDVSLMPYTEAVRSARNKAVSLVFWFE